ncbi:MAG: T9SS type A sorting domain-containing protein, partial [Bacteroidales bacterium]|nr:T9SS type A sorting domain-containing protein [Bacteroidales bacterium]
SGVYKGSQHLSEPSDGLFRLPEGANDWEQVLPNITDLDIPYAPSDIEIGADGRMYVGTMPNVEGDGGATILYSDDCLPGTWTINETYKELIENTPDWNLPGRVILASAPSDENRVFALIAQGIFYGIPAYECHIIARSDDKGENWEMVSVPTASNWSFIAWHALTAAVDPNDADRFFIGALDMWRSTDAGESWIKRSNWQGTGANFVHADHHRILFKDGSSDEFLVATDGGVFYSDDASQSIITFSQKNSGFNTLQFYKCAINPEINTTFFLGGLQDNGTKYYDGNPISNQNHVSGGDGGACFIDKNEPDVFITSSQNNAFYFFGNYQFIGATFEWQSGNFISSVDYDYKLNTLYANAVTVTNNLPDQILRISGVPYGPVEGGFLNMGTGSNVPFTFVKYSEHSSIGDARLFLGTQAGRLFRVENANTDPVVLEIGSNSFPAAAISCIAYAGSEDTLLVTFSNYGVTSVWQSYDAGQSWEEREGNLPDMPVRWALYHPQYSNSAMLATEIGIWTTYNLQDEFVLWAPDNNGLANVRIDMIQLRDADNTVLAGTHGRGFYTTTYLYDPTTKVDELTYKSPSIYPNPTKGSITIELKNEISEPFDICIYNNDYKKIRTFNFQNTASTARLDISDLSAGLYYISINTKRETLTGKVIKY